MPFSHLKTATCTFLLEHVSMNVVRQTQSGSRQPRTLGFASSVDLLTASNIKAEGHLGGGEDLVFKHLLILPLF